MSSVSKSSSSSASRRGFLSKKFQKPVSTQTHPYPDSSTLGRDSESTLVSPPSQSSTKKDGKRDPDAVFGALSSTHVPALPSDPAAPAKSKKTPAVKPAAAQQDAASSTPNQPLRRPLTQAQREQAIVDLSSRYGGFASPLPGGRWKV